MSQKCGCGDGLQNYIRKYLNGRSAEPNPTTQRTFFEKGKKEKGRTRRAESAKDQKSTKIRFRIDLDHGFVLPDCQSMDGSSTCCTTQGFTLVPLHNIQTDITYRHHVHYYYNTAINQVLSFPSTPALLRQCVSCGDTIASGSKER